MGNKCCCAYRTKTQRKITLLLVGLDNAGKTVAAKGLAGEKSYSPVPTVGFSVIKLKYLTYDIKIYDLGGGRNIRNIWVKYFNDAHGIIFVLDSTDVDRLDEAKNAFFELVSHEKVAGKPVLLLANKCDKENALDEIDIIEFMRVEDIVNKYKCPTLVQSCSATEHNVENLDKGISKGYVWLMKYISRNYDSLNNRVENDVYEQELIEREEMLEKLRRIKEIREKELQKKDVDAIETYSQYHEKINGNISKTTENKHIISDNSSENSYDSFPRVYLNENLLTPRPRSAVQLIKHQLQLNEYVKSPEKHKINKTAPLHLFGVQSASERSENKKTQLRSLKSADDRIFTVSDKKIGPSGDFHKEIFQLKTKNDKINGSVHNRGDNNEICTVDIG